MSEREGPRTAASSGGKVQLTPADWIQAAMQVLVDRSIDAVRVDVLAKTLQVTRGSFYWHFKDRDDLLGRVLLQWRDTATEQQIARFEAKETRPAELLEELISLPFRGRSAAQSASVELAVRAWARRDDMARQMVDAVDEQRLSYIAQCFSSLGFSIGQARLRAFTFYSYMLAESLIRAPSVQGRETERRAFVKTLIMLPLPEQG